MIPWREDSVKSAAGRCALRIVRIAKKTDAHAKKIRMAMTMRAGANNSGSIIKIDFLALQDPLL